ncbi:hypothetical protein UCRPC4_g00500 [Phaeomoniella chlamydospora]|uniref:Uncharacterized protein n=1 Tax=Phaeomoniella chlamydospora TaxID=158046 RepID=A0A0G2F2P0_PHACM|nr:hypothetical protein UCRPC4_g00500 [Phaeomoniella chlamydospora]
MRHARSALPLAALTALGAEAQYYSPSLSTPTFYVTNTAGNPSSTVTSYYSTCPPGLTSTVTLPTQTFCPGPYCTSLPTGVSTGSINGVGGSVSQSGDFDVGGNVNVNGNVNINNGGTQEWTTIINEYCPICEGGYQAKNVTITEACPCMETKTALPGYTTTEIPCTVEGTATTTTVFVTCSSATAAISPAAPDCAHGCTAVPAPTTPAATPAESSSPGTPDSGSSTESTPESGNSGSNSENTESGSGSSSSCSGTESSCSESPESSAAAAPGGGSRIAGTWTGTNSTHGGASSSTSPLPMVPYEGSASAAFEDGKTGLFLTFGAGLCGFVAWML